MRRAVVLLSGGLDSAVTLYIARKKGFQCSCLIFDYGQRHRREIKSAKRIAQSANCKYRVLKINLPWRGSALLDKALEIYQRPVAQSSHRPSAIANTYVPARNIIFLSFALSYAEATRAQAIFIGANAVDFSGYPDCRPQFYRAFVSAANLGTKSGAEGRSIKIPVPLINKSKAQIIKTGLKLGVPFELTWSCYRGGIRPCKRCDSCYFRAKGFREAGVIDPLLVRSS